MNPALNPPAYWMTVGWFLALLVFHDLLLVMMFDAAAWYFKWPSVSDIIRNSPLSLPVAVCAAITVGVIIFGHFVLENMPGH